MSTDYWLIQKIKKGNTEACDELVSKYYKDILNYFTYRCVNKETAKDLTQDTFLKFFEHIYEYQFQNKTKNYLYTIAGNLLKNSFAGKNTVSLDEYIENGGEICEQADKYNALIDRTDFASVLNKLPDDLKKCISMYYMQGYKQKEISIMLGISLPLVKYRIKRAKKILENLWKGRIMMLKKQCTKREYDKEISQIVKKAGNVLYEQAEKNMLSYHQFLNIQLKQIQKRWWVLQAFLLIMICFWIHSDRDGYYVNRSLGIAGAMFIIFLVPELWKNEKNKCLEIEMSSYFSIRQIYAARICILGIVDIFMITVFGVVVHFACDQPVYSIVFQFLLPMVVTASICFKTLDGKNALNSGCAIIMCFIWVGIWWGITSIGGIYDAVIYPIWAVVLMAAIIYLIITIKQFFDNCNKYWEVRLNEIGYRKC